MDRLASVLSDRDPAPDADGEARGLPPDARRRPECLRGGDPDVHAEQGTGHEQ